MSATERESVERTVLLTSRAPARRARVGAAAAATTIALVALVAALSTGLTARVRALGGGGLGAHALLGDAAAVVLVLAIACLALIAYDAWPRRAPREATVRWRPRFRRPATQRLELEPLLAALAILLVAAVALAAGVLGSAGGQAGGGISGQHAAGRINPGGAPLRAGGASVPANGVVVLVGAALVALVAGLVVLRARRARSVPAPAQALVDALDAAVDESLEDLEHEPDARRAVIKAYERMERALGAHGLARAQAETPSEYLARALGLLAAGARSIGRLTALFEQARYSRRWIDAAMKDEAIGALRTLRSELRDGVAA